MSILHRRRQVKERWKQREVSGERCSAPHEYERASVRTAAEPVAAEPPPPREPRKPRVRRKAKAKAKRA